MLCSKCGVTLNNIYAVLLPQDFRRDFATVVHWFISNSMYFLRNDELYIDDLSDNSRQTSYLYTRHRT